MNLHVLKPALLITLSCITVPILAQDTTGTMTTQTTVTNSQTTELS